MFVRGDVPGDVRLPPNEKPIQDRSKGLGTPKTRKLACANFFRNLIRFEVFMRVR
jgi:hypothetical protein